MLTPIKAYYVRCWWYISLRFTMSERRANFPCRQLNSEKIKGAALCYLSPIVVDKCSVVTCKCTRNMDESLQKAWNEVCRTQDACDKALQGLYSKWIEMSIMNPYYESISWIRKPDFDIIFCRGTKCGLFSLVLSAHKGHRKRRRKIKKPRG